MERRRLGTTDLHLTTVGLGTWAIGGPWDFGWGPQDDRLSERAIDEAFDHGVNWVDTAPAYGLGHSEEVVGRALARHCDRVIVATKCGRVWDDPASGSIHARLSADSVRAECEASLSRLGVDAIDLYQVHWPQPVEAIEEAWETMARLKQEGKVRHLGVSNFSVEQMRRLQRIHPIASLQPPYSMLSRHIEDEILGFCADHGIGVVAYSPMQAGLLTGKFTAESVAALPAGDWRHRNRHFQEPELSLNLAFVEGLRPIAERAGRSLGELAVAWTLRRPEVTAAIVGARRPGQIAQTAGASGWRLDEEDAAAVDTLLAERARALAEVS
jgi:aryl-alcohol dehydrogenase-like predicted oxidoreductase